MVTIIDERESCKVQDAKCKVQSADGYPYPSTPPLLVWYFYHMILIYGGGSVSVSYRLVVYLC